MPYPHGRALFRLTMMMHRRRQSWPGRATALLALVALVLRLSAAMAMPAPAVLTLDVLLGDAICHAGDATDAPSDAPAPAHECALCPACLAATPVLPAASLPVPAPLLALAARFALPPPATGPPARFSTTAQPRAPPRLA